MHRSTKMRAEQRIKMMSHNAYGDDDLHASISNSPAEWSSEWVRVRACCIMTEWKRDGDERRALVNRLARRRRNWRRVYCTPICYTPRINPSVASDGVKHTSLKAKDLTAKEIPRSRTCRSRPRMWSQWLQATTSGPRTVWSKKEDIALQSDGNFVNIERFSIFSLSESWLNLHSPPHWQWLIYKWLNVSAITPAFNTIGLSW